MQPDKDPGPIDDDDFSTWTWSTKPADFGSQMAGYGPRREDMSSWPEVILFWLMCICLGGFAGIVAVAL